LTGRRLKPQQRREHLLDTGATLFAENGVVFPDWKPVDLTVWPAENGLFQHYRREGANVHTGKKVSFYSISFVETNDDAQITHWSTYVDDDVHGPFLKTAIGACGPCHADEYMRVLARHFEKHSITL
ncbi:hypothetical protein MRAB57_137, partial [Mycobacterium rhizamassiliense]